MVEVVSEMCCRELTESGHDKEAEEAASVALRTQAEVRRLSQEHGSRARVYGLNIGRRLTCCFHDQGFGSNTNQYDKGFACCRCGKRLNDENEPYTYEIVKCSG